MRQRNMLVIGMGFLAIHLLAGAASAYYSPTTGRFLNRDPLGEQGAILLRTQSPTTRFIPRDPTEPPSVYSQRYSSRSTSSRADSVVSTDELNLYQFVSNVPTIMIDPLGLCETLTFTGHGMNTQCDITSESLADGSCIPEFMTFGIADGSPILTAGLVKAACSDPSSLLCCDATLYLYACGIGKNEELMRALAAGCNKITKVCGYTKSLQYIPYFDIVIPLPWNWNCVDVN